MTSSQSTLSDLASFFSISSSPVPTPEIRDKSSTNENECIEIAMTNDVPPPNNTAPLSPINTTTTDNMSNGMSVEEGVPVVRHTTPSIEISQDCAYDMTKIKIDYISQPTTTASDSGEGEDNDGHNPTSSKRREIFDYLHSKLSKIDKRRRILLVHLLMLIVIGLVLVIVIVSTTSVSVKSKDQRQSSSVENAPSQFTVNITTQTAYAETPKIPIPTYMPTIAAYPTYSPINGWGDSSPTPPGDLFLMSGQSNIIGHSTSRQSIGKNNDYWLELKSILEAANNDDESIDEMEDELYAVIERTNNLPRCLLGCKTKNVILSNLQSTAQGDINEELKECKQGCRGVASTLTSELLTLYNLGLLNNIDEPLVHGKCSFVEPMKDKGDGVEYISQGTVPINWNVGCGKSFGSEYMFGRALEMGTNNSTSTSMTSTYTTNFELVKNGRGGSELYKHWYPNHGLYWNELQKTITQRKGQDNHWKAFIWHQGENDAFIDDSSTYYLSNLTTFVNAVRMEMYDSSEVSTWQCKEEIPTIIIQLGHWPIGEDGDRIRDAQATFCDEDIGRSILVTTNDLSHNYHYDAASFLVIGYRIALAYEEVMKRNVTCPY